MVFWLDLDCVDILVLGGPRRYMDPDMVCLPLTMSIGIGLGKASIGT